MGNNKQVSVDFWTHATANSGNGWFMSCYPYEGRKAYDWSVRKISAATDEKCGIFVGVFRVVISSLHGILVGVFNVVIPPVHGILVGAFSAVIHPCTVSWWGV